MFGWFKKFIARRQQRKTTRELEWKALSALTHSLDRMPKDAAPKGKRWLIGLDGEWSLVDIPKPDPARKAAPPKRKAKARA